MKTKIILTVLFLCVSSFAYELTLYSMPSPREINWKSPRGLSMASLLNRFTFRHVKNKHAIGHVFVELSHEGESLFTGSIPDAENSSQKWVMKDGYGLGILFAPIEGRLDNSDGLKEEVADRYKSGRIGFIRFLINEDTYNRLHTYLDEYIRRGYNNIYNGLNKPREGLGAGCSAFGISFVELAGLMREDWRKEWPVNVRIPNKLIGGPMTGNKVSMLKLMTVGRWANEDEPHTKLHLYEPYYIWEWIVKTHKEEVENPTNTVKALKRGKAYGLEYDMRGVKCPTEPIFQGEAADEEIEY